MEPESTAEGAGNRKENKDLLLEKKPNTAQQRFNQKRSLKRSHALVNEMKRRKTLARASLPRSHRYFRHTTEEFVIGDNSDPKNAQSRDYARKDPVDHSQEHLKELNEKKAAITGIKEEEEELCDLEKYIRYFTENSLLFEMVFVKAMGEIEEIDKKAAASKAKGTRKTDSSGNALIGTYFRKISGGHKESVRRFYVNFYYEKILGIVEAVETPALGETEIGQTAQKSVSGGEEQKKTPQASEFVCPSCGVADGKLFVDDKTKEITCCACGVVSFSEEKHTRSFAEIQSSTMRDPAPYKRISHFKEFLTRLEGQERTEIPQQVVHRVLEECQKRKINPLQKPELITYMWVRKVLQESGYSHFFENIVKIIAIVTKRSPLTFTTEQREELLRRFHAVQEPYEKHKGKRKNFLSYSFCVFKFCEQIGAAEFLEFLPLLRPQNLLAADRIWAYICADLGYEFIATDPHGWVSRGLK